MLCSWKILQMMGIYFLMSSHCSFCKATPLIGDDVRIADLGKLPFIVSLSSTKCGYLEKAELSHFCGGALITKQHVLTVAHCLKGERYSSVVVKIGSIDLRKSNAYRVSGWLTYSEWSGIQVPEEYNANDVYDIAIVKLLNVVEIDFELPTISYTPDKDLYGLSAVTGGWGTIEDNKRPRYMRIVKFFISFPEKCEVFTTLKDNFLKRVLPKINLCSTGAPTGTVMPGDSGSPLLRGETNIVAVNIRQCFPSKNDVPLCHYRNLHSSVNAYKDFIEEVKQL